jgi:serine protease Do
MKNYRLFLAALTTALFLTTQAVAASVAGLPVFTGLAEKSGPAVVNISTVKLVKGNQQLQDFFRFHRSPNGQRTPFDDFFDQFEKYFKQRPDAAPRKQRSLGSGFVISPDGYIVTNNHVIADADEVEVNLQGADKPLPATIVGRDQETDLALLKVDAGRSLPVVSFGDSDKMKVGEWVMAIGNPFGLDHTVTVGIISAKGRIIGSGPFDDFIQTDASINPGNSGGPLLNMDGEVIGINSAIIASGQGIGFAVPSNLARKVIAQLKENKKVSRGWLGVTIQDVDENTAKALDLKEPKGALVASVIDGQPAAKAGVKSGDVIVEVNGEKVDDSSSLLRRIAGLAPGDKAKLTLWRAGKNLTVNVILGERDLKQMAQAQPQEKEAAESSLGLSLRPVQDNEAEALGLDKPQGLLVTAVSQGSPAQEGDVRPGDVILQINQQPVTTVAKFKDILEGDAKKKGVLLLLIQRQGQSVFRTITLAKDKK